MKKSITGSNKNWLFWSQIQISFTIYGWNLLGMKITKSMWPEIVLPHYALVADESRLGWLSFVWIYETSKFPKDYNIYLAGLKVRYLKGFLVGKRWIFATQLNRSSKGKWWCVSIRYCNYMWLQLMPVLPLCSITSF